MGSPQSVERGLRSAGAVLGLAGAVAALVVWSVPPGSRAGELDLSAQLLTSGALQSTRNELFTSRQVRPGNVVSVRDRVRNSSGKSLEVRLVADGAAMDLDGDLIVRMDAGSRTIYEAPLSGLRNGADVRFGLKSGESRPLRFTVRLRPGASTNYAGRYEQIALHLQEELVR